MKFSGKEELNHSQVRWRHCLVETQEPEIYKDLEFFLLIIQGLQPRMEVQKLTGSRGLR